MSTEIVRAEGPSLPDMVSYAERLAHADLLPKQFVNRPANVLYAMEYGRTLGITPIAAITGIHVIEGKPSASSGLIGGLVRQAGHKLRVQSDGATTATAQIIRADDPDFTYAATWTLARAAQAGLCQIKDGKPWARDSKGRPTAWEKYPAAMLKARAITEVARDACEDVLFGLHYTPEELGAVIDQDGMPVDAPVQPLRAVEHEDVTSPVQQLHAQGYADLAAKAETRAQVKELWAQAGNAGHIDDTVKAAGAEQEETLRAYLTRLGQTLPDEAPEPAGQTPASGGEDEPLDVETVDPPEVDEHTAAEIDLRAVMAELGVNAHDIDRDAEGALGLPIAQASADAIRALTAQLRGNAA